MFSNMPELNGDFLKRWYLRNDKTFDYCFIYRNGEDDFITYCEFDDIPDKETRLTKLHCPPGLTRRSCQ